MALSWSKRVRLIAAWCLGAYLADMFIRMGWIKFDPEGFWTAAFAPAIGVRSVEHWLSSIDRRNSPAKHFGWFHPIQGLSRAVVELPSDGVQVSRTE